MKELVRNIVAAITYWLGLGHLIFHIYPKLKGKHILCVIAFHRIVPSELTKHLAADYDKGLDVDYYELTLNHLKRYFDFIGLDDFVKYASGEETLQRHSLMITFDDADSEFVEYALPILKKNQWPAVMFAPVDYIDTDRRFWHLRVSSMMLQMNNQNWQAIRSGVGPQHKTVLKLVREKPEYNDSMRKTLCRDVINRLDGLTDDEIDSSVGQLESLVDKDYNLGIKCMGWEELQSLEKAGIKIESHSVTHRKLGHLSHKEVACELEDSKSILENRLRKEVKAMCYPAGSYDQEVAELADHAGYRVCFTTERGLVDYPLKKDGMFTIPRLAFGGETKYDINLSIARLAIGK